MYELKKIGKVFTSKFVGTGPSSYKKRIYRAAVSQRLRYTDLQYILPPPHTHTHTHTRVSHWCPRMPLSRLPHWLLCTDNQMYVASVHS